MKRTAIVLVGAAAVALATGVSPAAAQTFKTYACADGTQFIVGFFQYDKRAHLQIDGKAVALSQAHCAVRLALQRRRHRAEGRQGGRHDQARQAAGVGVQRAGLRKRLGTGRPGR